ncbi:hypothetical protein F4777DRAFT_434886 [Nemania sp. FL0916]|nr:hypothetical protein F4777DRAFT_434886 [Nemania sp. FL0916]
MVKWRFILQIAPLATATQRCYYPQGNLSGGDVVCGDGVNHSHCCGPHAICLTNKLCLQISDTISISRASCTDPTWQAPECPDHCRDVNVDKGIPLALYSYGKPSKYCCGVAATQKGSSSLGCSSGSEPFEIGTADILPGKGILKNFTSLGPAQPNPASPTQPSTSDPVRSSSSGPVQSSSTGSENQTCPAIQSPNTVLAVGAGVGIPLVIISIATLSWALWERHHRHNEAIEVRRLLEVAKARSSVHYTFVPQSPGKLAELRHERDPVEIG